MARLMKLALAGAITAAMLAFSIFAAQPAQAQSLETVVDESADVVGATEDYVAAEEAAVGEAAVGEVLTSLGSSLQ